MADRGDDAIVERLAHAQPGVMRVAIAVSNESVSSMVSWNVATLSGARMRRPPECTSPTRRSTPPDQVQEATDSASLWPWSASTAMAGGLAGRVSVDFDALGEHGAA